MRAGAALWIGVVAATLASLGGAASAQPVVPPPEQSAGDMPDVVHLRDGGLVRGAIVEMQPGQFVVIRLVTGEIRRIEGNLIASVGSSGPSAPVAPTAPPPPPPPPPPASSASQEPQPFIAVNAQPARLHLFASEPNLTYHLRSGMSTAVAIGPGGRAFATASHYDRICTAPCEATLPSGTYDLALARADGSPVGASSPISIAGPSRLDGSYSSNAGLRIAGLVTLIAGGVVGATMLVLGVAQEESCSDYPGCVHYSMSWPLVGLGIGVLAAAGIVYLVLGFRGDTVDISVTPEG